MTAREAGRALDAEVAERLLGSVWDEKRCRVCGWPLGDSGLINAHCLPDNCSMRPAPVLRADRHAPFSTDIALAFLVVEVMIAKGYRWRVGSGIQNPAHAFAVFWMPRGFHVQHDAEAETRALAICLASLAMLDDPETQRADERSSETPSASFPSDQ